MARRRGRKRSPWARASAQGHAVYVIVHTTVDHTARHHRMILGTILRMVARHGSAKQGPLKRRRLPIVARIHSKDNNER